MLTSHPFFLDMSLSTTVADCVLMPGDRVELIDSSDVAATQPFHRTGSCVPVRCDRLFAGVNTGSGSDSSRDSRSVWDLGADFPTLPDLPVVPWLRFAQENVGHDGLAAQDGGSAEGARLLSETTIHG